MMDEDDERFVGTTAAPTATASLRPGSRVTDQAHTCVYFVVPHDVSHPIKRFPFISLGVCSLVSHVRDRHEGDAQPTHITL